MAEAMGQKAVFAPMTAGFEQLGVADAAKCDLDQDLPGKKGGDLQLRDFQGFSELDQNRGPGFHDLWSWR